MYKKISAVTAAMIFSLASVSCSEKQSKISPETVPISVTQTMYKDEHIETPEGFSSMIECRTVSSTGDVMMIYLKDHKEITLDTLDSELNVKSSIKLTEKRSDNTDYFADISCDGTISLLIVSTDYDYPEDMSEFDADDFNKNAVLNVTIKNFNSSGEMLSEIECGDLKNYYEIGNSFVQGFLNLGENYILVCNNFRALIDKDGNAVNAVKTNSDSLHYGKDSNDRIIAACEDGYAYVENNLLDKPDKLNAYPKYTNFKGAPLPASGQFTAYLLMGEGLYGISDESEPIKVLDFQRSMITPSEIYSITEITEGKFLMTGIKNSSGSRYISLLTVRPDDYKPNKTTVKAMVGQYDYDVIELVNEYSRSNDEFTVEIQSYSDMDEVRNAMLSGDTPDFISYGYSDDSCRYANMGAFCDMYELSEQYGGFKKEDILDNIIEGFETNGHLYSISDSFMTETLIANSEVLSKEHSYWTLEDMVKTIGEIPEDMYITDVFSYMFDSPESLFTYIAVNNSKQWIDYENGSCSFDNPKFVEFIKMCHNSADKMKIYEEWWNMNEEFVANDWEGYEFFYNEQQRMLMNKKTLFKYERISSIFDITSMYRDDIFNGAETVAKRLGSDDITVLGFPSQERAGCFWSQTIYSIPVNGKCVEGGWDFLNYIMSEDTMLSDHIASFDKLATRKDAFDAILERNRQFEENVHKLDDPLTDETIAIVKEFVSHLTTLKVTNPLYDVFSEEFLRYENGEITAEECAEHIQSRASIYVSEQF